MCHEIDIRSVTAAEAYAVARLIPELDPPYSWKKWQKRLEGKTVIALIATVHGTPAGCKVGYYERDHFYSWVGGVLPPFRRRGVARLLADRQEALVLASGTTHIRMKTRNRFVAMLHFALGRGFYIADVERRGEPLDWRITLSKNL